MRVNFSGSFCPAHQRHSKLNGLLFYTIYNSQAEKLIYGFKYEGLKQIAKFLGYLMAQILKEHPIFKKEIILCPVPMWFLKRLKRGFNQSELLAQDIGSRLNLDYANLLLKNRSTKSQTQLAEEQRIKNVQNSFVLSKLAHKINLKQKTIILVDDVYTTGSTLFEAAAVFKNHPLNRPKAIWGLVFARD